MITEVEEEDDHLNLKSQRFFIVEAGQERVLTLMEALWWDRLGGGVRSYVSTSPHAMRYMRPRYLSC